MLINFSSLLNGQEKSIHIDKKISDLLSDITKQDVMVKGELLILNNVLHINLSVELSLDMMCSRCLDDFIYPMSLQINEKIDLDDDGNEIQGDMIDLTELIRETILINIPIKPVCSPDCKGLCQYCGNNMNVKECNCSNNQVDPRLSVLNNIFNEDE